MSLQQKVQRERLKKRKKAEWLADPTVLEGENMENDGGDQEKAEEEEAYEFSWRDVFSLEVLKDLLEDLKPRNIITSIRTIIPYTEEWHEANSAMADLEDLRRIEYDLNLNRNLVTMVKIGKYSDALDTMMKGNKQRDFGMFNKLRDEMVREGTYNPPPEGMFSRHKTRARRNHENSLERAFFSTPELLNMQASSIKQLSKLATAATTNTNECMWRYRDGVGNTLKCHNAPVSTNMKLGFPMGYCGYHQPHCIRNHGGAQIPIKIPNAEALCMECYAAGHKGTPKAIGMNKVPGVYVAISRLKKAGKSGQAGGGDAAFDKTHRDDDASSLDSGYSRTTKSVITTRSQGEETSLDKTAEHTNNNGRSAIRENLCKWRPNPEEMKTEKKLYICKCEPFWDADANKKYAFCAMHLTNCVKDHASGSAAIEEPNIYGLCTMHHISIIGSAPEPVKFPYPGMELRVNPRAPKKHPLAPRWEKPADIVLEDAPLSLVHFKKNMSWWEQRKANQLYERQKLLMGNKCATKIQSVFRGYLERDALLKLRRAKLFRLRSVKVVRIQALARRYLGRKYYIALRAEYTRSCQLLQRILRGFLARRAFRKHSAAFTVQKLVHERRLRKFQDAVMAIVLVMRMRKQREISARLLQRWTRGSMTRMKLRRYWTYRTNYMNECAQRITNCVRIYVAKKLRRSLVDAQKRARLLKFFATRLAENLIALYRRKKAYELLKLQNSAARTIQRIYRAHHSVIVRRNLRAYRLFLQEWCRPQVARDFYKQMLSYGTGDLLNCKALPGLTHEEVFAIARMTRGSRTFRSRRRDVENAFLFRQSARSKQLIPWESSPSRISQAAFIHLLEEYYRENELFVSPIEINRLAVVFKDPHDEIKIDEFKKYFDMHIEPCGVHGRTICTECSFPKECIDGDCECTAFKLDQYGNGDVCDRCQHPITLHRKYPVQMKARGKVKFKDTIDLCKEPDLEVPTTVVGEIEIHVPTASEISEKKAQLVVKSTAGRSQASTPNFGATRPTTSHKLIPVQNSVASDLAACLIDGSVVEQEPFVKSYWRQNELELSIKKPKDIEKKNDSRMIIQTQAAPSEMNYSTPEKFWRNISKNQNKTVDEYTKGFGTNISFPIVSHAALSYTWDSSKVYVMLLRRLVYLGERHQLQADDGDFLRLVVDNMQAFERHWRKFVIDIRTGSLNKRLLLSDADRSEYLSSCIPSPAIANALDAAFRNLGFHMKVLGKDIMETKHAAPKVNNSGNTPFHPRGSNSESLEFIRLRKRRRSFGAETVSSMVHAGEMQGIEHHQGWQSVSSNILTCMECAPASKTIDPLLATIQKIHSHKSDNLEGRRRPNSMGDDAVRLTPIKKSSGKAVLRAIEKHQSEEKYGIRSLAAKMGTDLMKTYTENHNTSILNGINGRPITAENKASQDLRRGSETDILRPLEHSEVQSMIYKLETAPKSSVNDLLVKKDRLICPFPACGQNFISRDAALRHIKEHEQRHHLFSSAAEADSMMRSYWPTDLPWVDPFSKFNAPGVAPGSVVCPKCGAAFATNEMVQVHDRLKHVVKEIARLPPHVLCIGKASKKLPPDAPPLPSCPAHGVYESICSYCKEETPKPPLRFYPSIRINFTLLNNKGGSVVFSKEDSSKGVIIRSSTKWDGTPVVDHGEIMVNCNEIGRSDALKNIKHSKSKGLLEFKGLVMRVMLDAAGMPWLAVRRLLDAREARSEGASLCEGFDFEHELVVSQLSPPRWFPVMSVTNKFFLAIETKYNFKAKLKSGELPSENIYFIRLE